MTAREALPPILLVGAGRMGSAMFAGWAGCGLAPSVLVDPGLPPGVARAGDRMVASLDAVPRAFRPAAIVLAIKPQMMGDVLPSLADFLHPDAVVLSILAGKTLAGIAAGLAPGTAVVRAMPNTPAAIGQGMTVACANAAATAAQKALCTRLLEAVGALDWLEDESLLDRITAISGCGPAYVFLLAELLENEGVAMGIPQPLARRLARQTVSGAGGLLAASDESSADLRRAVTSAKGVTEQALLVLMEEQAWPASIRLALAAAVRRAGELAA